MKMLSVCRVLSFMFSCQFVSTLACGSCGKPVTPIHVIQGNGFKSSLVGETVTTEGIVTGIYMDEGQLGGFYLQALPSQWDKDPMTSEGLFIQSHGLERKLERGDLVRLTGNVEERYQVTQLVDIGDFEICRHQLQSLIQASRLEFPTDKRRLEAKEGMEIDLSGLVLTGQYYLGTYGQLSLAPQRLTIPTHRQRPGSLAYEKEQNNRRNQIIVDDASHRRHPDRISFLPGLNGDNAPRLGQKVLALHGQLHYAYDEYRVETSQILELENLKEQTLPIKSELETRIVAFNVLNAFNGNGRGEGFPTARGAKTYEEWLRQRSKLIAALKALDGDLYGLSELENDGYEETSVISEMTRAYNREVVPNRRLDFIAPEKQKWGGDAIAVGFLYRPQVLKPIGPAYGTQEPPFGKGRGPMLQTFEHLDSGFRFTAVVGHYKSKGCGRHGQGGEDRHDGQSCWSERRTDSSKVILNWAPQRARDHGSQGVIVMGDLNSYAKEDAIRIFEDSGWQNLGAEKADAASSKHSFVFMGQQGALDHILGDGHLSSYAIKSFHWNINSDAPRILDYHQRSAEQMHHWYRPTPLRSSDHDPILVDFLFR